MPPDAPRVVREQVDGNGGLLGSCAHAMDVVLRRDQVVEVARSKRTLLLQLQPAALAACTSATNCRTTGESKTNSSWVMRRRSLGPAEPHVVRGRLNTRLHSGPSLAALGTASALVVAACGGGGTTQHAATPRSL